MKNTINNLEITNSEIANFMTDIKERTFKFGIMIIKMVESLPKNTVGYAIGNQVIRSGTAIGAILEEASSSLSYNDFVKMLRTSCKEAKETLYWLRLIKASNVLVDSRIDTLIKECDEINRILTKSIATSEEKQGEYKIKRKKQ